jgi:hypothetical protein
MEGDKNMRKDNKYNRLTWHRKQKYGNHAPVCIKVHLMELCGTDTNEDPWELVDEDYTKEN